MSDSGEIMDKKPAVFLDRDGVLLCNKTPDGKTNYNQDPDNIAFEDGGIAALKKLDSAGFPLVIITNQGGIEAGYITEELLAEVHRSMRIILEREGVRLLDIFHCPHLHTSGCECRKPAPGMILAAAHIHSLDLASSWMIGDMTSDIQAGRSAGCRTVLVKTGFGGVDGYYDVKADFEAANLAEAAELIIDLKE